MAIIAPAYGTWAYGTAGYGTPADGASTGPGGGAGGELEVLFLEANDRHQIIACISDGTDYPPIFTYWNPAPAVWAEALAAPYPTDYPAFFAVDDAGGYPDARLESRWFLADAGTEEYVSGVLVRFEVRPTLMDNYDGGVGAHDPFFTIHVEGFGAGGVAATSGLDSLSTPIVASESLTWTGTAENEARYPWPNVREYRAPTRVRQPLRGYRVVVDACFGVEFLSFEVMGSATGRRTAS